MKVVILAGGLGTRLSEETALRPKPMVEIGGQPILWHIMKHYAHHGFTEFICAVGYKGEVIKRYFLDYQMLSGGITIDFSRGEIQHHSKEIEDWTVHLVDTGQQTLTGGRLKRLEPWLKDEPFMLTYGDGVSDVDLGQLLDFHRARGRIATITAVRPPARFGGLSFDGDLVREFKEKPQIGEGWINGGFMVIEPQVHDYIEDDATSFEADTLEQLANEGQLVAYTHVDFWQCMDTLRDVRYLRSMWESGNAPWVTW